MTSTWLPPDIAEACSNQHAPLTSCSQTGFMYLALLTQLFGKSIDSISYPKSNPYSQPPKFISNDNSIGTYPGVTPPFTNSPFENSAFGTNSNFGSSESNFQFDQFTPGLGPLDVFKEPTNTFKTKTHSFGPKGSRGVSHTSFTIDHPLPKSDYGSTSKFEDSPPTFDSNYISRKGFFDAETADSKKVTVTAEKKESSKIRKKRNAPEEYDFIVVGAGSAGCVIANRLSEVKNWRVLLLEAGPEEPEVTSVPSFAPVLAGSSIDWQYRTQPEELTCRAQVGQTCRWISGRVMGGSSAINYLVYMRGNKNDYDGWADLGNYGWSYSEVLPYFKKSENNQNIEGKDKFHHGTNGPLNVERFSYVDRNARMLLHAFKETGLPLVDLNGENQLGTMIAQSTSKNGRRMSTNSAFIKPIRKNRLNLTIKTSAQVIKILIEPKTKVAYGVRYNKNGKIYEVLAKKEIIVSAGALNSPKILMLSGIGPKDELEDLNIPVIQNLQVGHNLHDHSTTEAMLMGLTSKSSTLISGRTLIHEIEEFHKLGYNKGPLSSIGPVQVTAFIRTKLAEDDPTIPDIQFHFDGRNLKEFYSDPPNYLASRIFPFAYYDSINVRPILLLPKSRGYLSLNKTNPVYSQLLIYPRFFNVKHDIDTLIAGLEFITQLENTTAFQEYGVEFIKKPVDGCTNYIWGTYDYFFCIITRYTSTIFHPTGTCKMGPHYDEDAVVDPRLRVYGIDHLRVADASIMPNIPRGNTNIPVIMIGEKVSDMIKDDWNHYED